MTTTKRRPTDEELDEACMLACGWELITPPGCTVSVWMHGYTIPIPSEVWDNRRSKPFDFCTDNDAAQELIQSLASRNGGTAFDAMHHLHLMLDPEQVQAGHSRDYLFLTAPPRAIVVACLKALGSYREDWEETP